MVNKRFVEIGFESAPGCRSLGKEGRVILDLVKPFVGVFDPSFDVGAIASPHVCPLSRAHARRHVFISISSAPSSCHLILRRLPPSPLRASECLPDLLFFFLLGPHCSSAPFSRTSSTHATSTSTRTPQAMTPGLTTSSPQTLMSPNQRQSSRCEVSTRTNRIEHPPPLPRLSDPHSMETATVELSAASCPLRAHSPRVYCRDPPELVDDHKGRPGFHRFTPLALLASELTFHAWKRRHESTKERENNPPSNQFFGLIDLICAVSNLGFCRQHMRSPHDITFVAAAADLVPSLQSSAATCSWVPSHPVPVLSPSPARNISPPPA